MANELGALEYGEVLGDSGLRDAGAAGESVDGLLAVAGELFEDRPAGRVGEGAEDVIAGCRFHRKNITVWLLVVKRDFRETANPRLRIETWGVQDVRFAWVSPIT